MTEQLVITNNRIADILDRLTVAPTKHVQDTIELATQPMPPIQNAQNMPQTVSMTGNGREMTDAELRVWRYLETNPDGIALSVRKLGEATDTNKTTAAAILAKFKQRKVE